MIIDHVASLCFVSWLQGEMASAEIAVLNTDTMKWIVPQVGADASKDVHKHTETGADDKSTVQQSAYPHAG
jgi:hypothetical protein